MEEKVQQKSIQGELIPEEESPPEPEITRSKNWIKPVVFAVLGLIIAAGLFGAGYKFAQIRQLQVAPTQTLSLTPSSVVELSPTPKVSPLPTGSPAPRPSPRAIAYKYIDSWIEFDSPVGYSVQFPPAYRNLSTEFNVYGKDGCTTSAIDGLGGIISSHVFPYAGGSRRELFYSIFGKEGYDYKFEEVLVSGINSLVIEIGPKGDSGTGVCVVIPKGNSALLLHWDNRYMGEEWDRLIGTIKIGQKLDISKCSATRS